jgi:hypothetical protein
MLTGGSIWVERVTLERFTSAVRRLRRPIGRERSSHSAMSQSGVQRQLAFMLRAQIAYKRRSGRGMKVLDLAIGDHYGLTADVAHEVLLVVTAARKPIVVDASGRFYRVPRKRLCSVMVWQCPAGQNESPAI